MAYKVIVDDGIDVAELDAEDIEITARYSIAEITDIAARNDSIKSIVFKGNKTNNLAFGNMFNANKTTDTSITNKLGFNYNPIRTVRVTVLKDSSLVFQGSLRVSECDINFKTGEGDYNTIVTSGAFDFKTTVKNSFLTDLDFSDLKHRYKVDVISNSWATQTERYNETTSSFYPRAFRKGSGYVYGFADYGVTFLDLSGGSSNVNLDPSKIHALNFRPGIYVKEYFDRIFAQADFTYEVRGSVDFKDRFNSLVIPNGDEKMNYKLSGFNQVFEKTIPETQTSSLLLPDFKTAIKYLSFDIFPTLPVNTIYDLISRNGTSTTYLKVDRAFVSDAAATAHFVEINNPYDQPMTFKLQMCEREIGSADWAVIAENNVKVPAFSSVDNVDISISVGERAYKENFEVCLRVFLTYTDGIFVPSFGPTMATFTCDTAKLSVPKDALTQFQAETQIGATAPYDAIIPTPPASIKQYDLIKDVMTVMNLYLYPDPNNHKHLIFQQYDDYWAYALPQYIKTTAIDWTSKVDLKSNGKMKSNLSLPKTYTFTYKDDSDRLNADYKKKYGKTYGSFTFDDSFGVTDEKKVSVNFSPTPITTYTGTNRYHPVFYTVDSGNKKPVKTNIRLLYYNGLLSCNEFTIAKDKFTTTWTTEDLATFQTYPNISSYYYVSGRPVEDLNFGRPNELYFAATPTYFNVDTAYTNYYINQTAELTNPNLSIFEMNILLNEVDIANLDLRTPVFIDNNFFGHAYYKVLLVEFESFDKPSRVTLQKIPLGTDR